MPVTMGGMASGVDTESIINKLVEVESRSIVQYEQTKAKSNQKKDALDKLSTQLKELEKSAKELYGFRANFDEKKGLSSNPAAVEVIVGKDAQSGLRKLTIDNIASKNKITSDPIDGDKKLAPGKFTISVNGVEESVKFNGGTLKALMEKLNEVAGGIVATSYVNTSGNKYSLTIESKVSGKKGEIIIKGDKDMLIDAGIVKGEKSDEKLRTNIVFDRKFLTGYSGTAQQHEEDGSAVVGSGGASLEVKGLLWREYALPVETVLQEDTLLVFDFNYMKEEKLDEEGKMPFQITSGPEEKVVIKGIELEGYNVSRVREDEKEKVRKFDAITGIGVVFDQGGNRVEKLYPVDRGFKGKMEIPVGKDSPEKRISKVIFYCNDGTANFSKVNFFTPEKDKGILDPKNTIAEAADAKMNLDGVDIYRDKNNDITDVIKGVTINLKGASKLAVEINVEHDLDASIDKIKKFVEAFNRYVDFNRLLTKAARNEKPGDYKSNKKDQGPLMGDITVIRLESTLKQIVNGAYSSRAENPIKIFPQMGVSTGSINADWQSIKEGKLIIDESVLKKIISENSEGVRLFFGSDTDGDNSIDNGMAYVFVTTLQPYVGYGNNIIKSKIDLESNSIKLADERIERQTEHLKKYEEKLRSKFTAMEKAIQGSKAQKGWMNAQMGGGDEGK